MIYLHVMNKPGIAVKSPVDSIVDVNKGSEADQAVKMAV